MICIQSADATATPSSLASLKFRNFSTFLVLVYPDYPGKEAIKWVLLLL